MSYIEVVTYPYYFFIDLFTSFLSNVAPAYTVVAGLVLLGLVMLCFSLIRRN